MTGDVVAARRRCGLGDRHEHREVIADLAVAGGEDLAGDGLLEQPLERTIAAAPEIGGQTGPVEVHVDAQSRRRRAVGEAPLLPADAGEIGSQAAQLGRHGKRQVPGVTEVLEVLAAEPVVPVVAGGATSTCVEDVVGQQGGLVGKQSHQVLLRIGYDPPYGRSLRQTSVPVRTGVRISPARTY